MNEFKHKEINTLVEHVQLNKAGWLLEGLKGIIIQIYGERNNPALTIKEVKELIGSYDNIDFKPIEIEKGYNSLISSGILIKIDELVKKDTSFFSSNRF